MLIVLIVLILLVGGGGIGEAGLATSRMEGRPVMAAVSSGSSSYSSSCACWAFFSPSYERETAMKSMLFAAALLASVPLAGCAVNAAGNETIGGINTGIPAAQVAVAQADAQAAINALPTLCNDFAVGAAMTNAELQVLASVSKLPAKTIANISNASAKGLIVCQGTLAIVAPLAAASQ